MNISIHDIKQNNDELEFSLKNCDLSIVNALRRTILTDIDTVVFRTTPYEKSTVEITENTSRLNNEIIKQRLSCIPIHIMPNSANLENYLVELNEENDSTTMKYITTEHFKIKNIETDKYLDRSEVKRIFPKNKITNEYILITRLRPSLSVDASGEKIKLTGKFTIGNAKEDGCFNVASTCAYGMTGDPVKQKEIWKTKEKELKDSGLSSEEIMDEKENWYNHDAKRVYKDNAFDFKIETVGVYSTNELVVKACNSMIERINKLSENIGGEKYPINASETLMSGLDVKMYDVEYSVGKSIEYVMFKKYYMDEDIAEYVGFKKFHPHDKYSVLRVVLKDEHRDSPEADVETFKGMIRDCSSISVGIFNAIISQFTR